MLRNVPEKGRSFFWDSGVKSQNVEIIFWLGAI